MTHSDGITQQGYQDLLQQLGTLRESYPSLGHRLEEAAQSLQAKGTPPHESLVAELTNYCQKFAHLRGQVQGPSAGPVNSLAELENLVKTQLATMGTNSQKQEAIALLDRILSIRHQDQRDFAPLESVKARANEMRRNISETPGNELHPNAQVILKGKHPITAILTLIEKRDQLSDDEWANLEEEINVTFGKQIAIAISRGKLQVTAPATPAAATTTASTIKVVAPTTSALPEIIVVPASSKTTQHTADPEIKVLSGTPAPVKPQDVIIVPGLQVSNVVQTPQGQKIIFGESAGNKATTTAQNVGSSVPLRIIATLQGLGDRAFGAQEYAGTRGQGRRLEGFQIDIINPIPGLALQYMANIEGTDTNWANAGQFVGSREQGKRIEGIAFRLSGPEAANYNVYYTAHIQNVGDTPVMSNGQYCGTRGRGYRVEGMKVWIQRQ